MIDRESVEYARALIKSISRGINKIELGSDVEYNYIREKVDKLDSLVGSQ